MTLQNQPVIVSIGEPSGIGPDIIVQTIAANAEAAKSGKPNQPFVVLGDPALLEARAKLMGVDVVVKSLSMPEHFDPESSDLQVISLSRPMESEPGRPAKRDGFLVIEAIRSGVDLTIAGRACALVTCPINKKILYDCDFVHPGHTEYLAHLATEHTGEACHPVMMLSGPDLKTVPVTIHIALSDVKKALTTDLILETARICAADLQSRFGIREPRLAFAGLNPHAGEAGTMGMEDMTVVEPAVKQLAEEGIRAIGPLPADTMFHARARATYDAAICMYHDQALIPAKTLAFDEAVNVTLGLPFIRTSPDHGTAFDIAGTGKANPSSFMAAVQLAHDMALKSAPGL